MGGVKHDIFVELDSSADDVVLERTDCGREGLDEEGEEERCRGKKERLLSSVSGFFFFRAPPSSRCLCITIGF